MMSRVLLSLALKGHLVKRCRIAGVLNQRLASIRLESTNPTDRKNDRIATIPNALTLSRIASIPFINYFILVDRHELACGLFVAAAITDFLDGYIARRFQGQSSRLGSILDPLADKLLIGSLAITLTYNHMLPVELLVLILARDLALIMASVFVRYRSIEKPVTFEKFVNVSKHAPVQVQADRISKINTFLQLALISVTLPSSIFEYNHSGFLIGLQYLTGLTTILSSISYLVKRGSYKLIEPNKK